MGNDSGLDTSLRLVCDTAALRQQDTFIRCKIGDLPGCFAAMANPFRAKPLTPTRIALAMSIAVVADALQFGGTAIGGPFAWAGFVEAVDVVAMILTMCVLGFHPLLLPTFVVEFIPIIDMLPTWTGCVGTVIFLRKRVQAPAPPVINTEPPPAPPNPPADSAAKKMPEATGPVIDV